MKTLSSSIRISILGARGVGKSAIAVRYLTRRFIGEYSSGIDISYLTTVTHRDTLIKVEILDTSSQKECRPVSHDVHDADAFVVVYCVTDEVSFKVAVKEIETIRSRSSSRTPILLLGNKLDLNHAKKVSQKEVDKIKETFLCQHTELSAAENHTHIVNCLHGLILDVVRSLSRTASANKRRKSVFANVSRKLGSVFRRKSLEDAVVADDKLTSVSHHFNRRSV